MTENIIEKKPVALPYPDLFLANLEKELLDFKNKHQKPNPDTIAALKGAVEEIKRVVLVRDETSQIVKGNLDKFIGGIAEDTQSNIGNFEKENGLDENDARSVLNFYIYYAIFVEHFNSMKVLYQVLLREYEGLNLLDQQTVNNLRLTAVKRINSLLVQHKWRGDANAANRDNFRNMMLADTRAAIANKASKKKSQPMAALCLSGGGIRSATFSLGVIQGLAKHGLLDKFDYLSTVSGGGYIGSWLTAFISRTPPKIGDFDPKAARLEAVQDLLANPHKQIEGASEEVKPAEPPQVTYLRSHSNYMSPRVGLFSVDTWTLIGVYLRNLLLNWTIFVPLLAAFLLVPRMLAEVVINGEAIVERPPSYYAAIFVGVSAFFGFVALFCISRFRPSLAVYLKDNSRFNQHFWRDSIGVLKGAERRILGWCAVPLLLFAFGISAYWNWAGQDPARLEFMKSIVGHLPAHRIKLLLVFAVVFVILAAINVYYRHKNELENLWDAIFGTVVIFLCIVTFGLQLWNASENIKIVGLMLFTESIGLAAFILVRVVIRLFRKKDAPGGMWNNFVAELSITFLTGALSGILLFLGSENLSFLYDLFGARTEMQQTQVYTTVAVPTFLLVFMLAATLFIGIGSKIMDDMDREWMSRFGAWILIISVAWLGICGIVFLGPHIFDDNVANFLRTGFGKWFTSVGGIAGAITLVFGFYAKSSPADDSKASGKKNAVLRIAPQIAAPIFAAFIVILVVAATNGLIGLLGDRVEFLKYDPMADNEQSLQGLIVYGIWIVVLTLIGALMGWWVNVNKFSLHGMYRDRIIRAYLGASNADRIKSVNSFTGMDDNDNIEMSRLFHKPFHVINMALNITKTSDLRWQSRKAESFTATPFHCGSPNMGGGTGNYRLSEEYGQNPEGKGISLGTAAAISGAAASPNMGYYTQSTPVSSLMALFNVRLGWWLGNTGRRGKKTYQKNAPDFAPRLLIGEAMGRSEDTQPYIYLSDGGHFDNLGFYEMVLRRCRFIVICDAGADGGFGFSDLGAAIHKIRVDMGIPVEFEPGNIPVKGRNCSIGTIKYSAIEGNAENDGFLIYIKPTLDGDEPIDIVSYAKKNLGFPHESTADLNYSETQFESYRSLGYYMITSICCNAASPATPCETVSNFKENVRAYLKVHKDKTDAKTKLSERQVNLSNPKEHVKIQ